MSTGTSTPAQAIQRVLATPPAHVRDGARSLAEGFARVPDAAREFRAELGLPSDRPVVLSGHQCELWHAGILAKWFASDALAQASGGAAAAFAWLLVDTDDTDPMTLRVPVSGPREERVTLAPVPAPDAPPGFRVPAGAGALRGAVLPAGVPPHAALGLARVITALAGREGEPTLAWQVGRATADVLADLTTNKPTLLAASAMARTGLFARVVEAIRADPHACAGAYNAASAQEPGAGIRALRVARDRVEVPLWRVRAGAAREPVFSHTLGAIPREELAPRALLLTGLLRLAGCEVFVHGLGGGVYDRVTHAWLSAWLPGPVRAVTAGPGLLAPAWVVSATAYVPGLARADAPTPADAARAAWHAHAAAHTPALLGDGEAQRRKEELVRRIARAKGDGAARRALYAELHALLERARAAHAPALREQGERAEQTRRRVRDSALAWDRTWPFVLFPRAVLAELRGRVRGAVLAGMAGLAEGLA